jgi:hypothetical protein
LDNLAHVRVVLMRGNRPEFLRWLDRAITLGWTPSPALPQHPLLADVAGDPAFERVMERADSARATLLARLDR